MTFAKFKTPHGDIDVSLWKGDRLWKTDPDLKRCRASVHGSGRGVSFYQCNRLGTIERKSGKDAYLFCKTHDPLNTAERQAKTQTRWKEEQKQRDAANAVDDIRDRIADAVLKGDLKSRIFLKKLFNLQQKALKAQAKLEKLKP